MSKIGLMDVDGHNFPNLALMKISGYHKTCGDGVEWYNGPERDDRVYMSKVFTFSPDDRRVIQADEVKREGQGMILKRSCPTQYEKDFAGWANKKERLKSSPLRDFFSPRKGFRCSEYLQILKTKSGR